MNVFEIKIICKETTEFEGNEGGVSTEVITDVVTTTEVTSEEYPTEAIVEYGYDYQYSDIEFLSKYDEEKSEYVSQEVDNRPYLSSEVANVDINDVYTMVLSIRNVVLLWFLIWLILKTRGFIHSILDIVLERSKRNGRNI